MALMFVIAIALAGCDSPVSFQPDSLPDATVGQPHSVQIIGFGATGEQVVLKINLTGTLPPGLTFSSTEQGVATIAGTPTTAGSYTFRVHAGGYCTMGGCQRGEQEYTLVVR